MMDVLNSAQWAELFYEGAFQLIIIRTRKYCLHWRQNFLLFGYSRSMGTIWNMMSSSQVEWWMFSTQHNVLKSFLKEHFNYSLFILASISASGGPFTCLLGMAGRWAQCGIRCPPAKSNDGCSQLRTMGWTILWRSISINYYSNSQILPTLLAKIFALWV